MFSRVREVKNYQKWEGEVGVRELHLGLLTDASEASDANPPKGGRQEAYLQVLAGTNSKFFRLP